MIIEFFVAGIPAPGGSKIAIPVRRKGGGFVLTRSGATATRLVDDCSRNGPWRRSVAAIGRTAYRGPLLTSALSVVARFIMPRPKCHFGTGCNAAVVKPSSPVFHIVPEDATKLWRSTEDALTGIIWKDDAQIVRQAVSKEYGQQPGAHIRVRTLE